MAQEIDYKTAKGWLKDEERELLFRLAGEVAGINTLILNIGVEFGASLACLRAGNPANRIIAFDPDMSKVLENGYGATLFEMSSYSQEAYFKIAMQVDDKKKNLRLIFVDGDHGKTGVLLDAKYADLLADGGYILFQDCWDWDKGIGVVHEVVPGVNEAVSEWYARPDIAKKFVELDSVGTTRVFMKLVNWQSEVKPSELQDYDKQQPKPEPADNSGANPDLQPETGNLAEHSSIAPKSKISGRASKNSNRRG